MSLSAWEQQALNSITDGLADSDPKLAELLHTFTRLASGEEMPVREKVRPRRKRRRPRLGKVRRHARRLYLRLGVQRAALLLWLLIAVTLIAVGVAMSHASSQGGCTAPWEAVSAPARNSCSTTPGAAGQPGAASRVSLSWHRPTYQRLSIG
jgi:Protein of unknown function (DUF3040)